LNVYSFPTVLRLKNHEVEVVGELEVIGRSSVQAGSTNSNTTEI
jgi:hypothetical protein